MDIRVGLISLLLIGSTAWSDSQDHYIGISTQTPTGARSISPQGLIAAYDFETYTQDGLLQDFGPLQNHGKVQQTQETDGLFGKARVFKTLKDVVDIPESESINLRGPLTIAAWIKLNTPNLHQHVLSCDDIFVLWTTVDNQYRLADTQANGISTGKDSTPLGSWHSVVGVLSATEGDALNKDNIEIFVDGKKLEGTIEPTWTPGKLREEDGCLIGAAVGGSQGHQDFYFDGVLDELSLFSRALTDEEIQIYSRRK